MSKKSRYGRPPAASQPASAGIGDAPTTRAAARRRQSATGSTGASGPLERYRGVIIGGLAAVGVGVVALFLFAGASAAPYTCGSQLTPGPVESAAAPGATPRLGFVTEDMGREHVRGTTTAYLFCPPASGSHWNVTGQTQLARRVYEPDDRVSPGNWVHNLEHGYVVIAYRGEPDTEAMSGIREVFDTAPQPEIAARCGLDNKVVAVRFDDMSEPFALLAWDRVLLLPEWDTPTALAFAEQWQESPQMPEPSC